MRSTFTSLVRQNPASVPAPAPVPAQAGGEDQPPYLVPGKDLSNFEIPENTPVNSVVYTLEGVDPEGARVFYTISGDNFSIDRETGRIRLREPLDREAVDMLDVVITIQDENYRHIIPFRRTIKGESLTIRKVLYLHSSRISSCVRTVDMVMCLHTWSSPAV